MSCPQHSRTPLRRSLRLLVLFLFAAATAASPNARGDDESQSESVARLQAYAETVIITEEVRDKVQILTLPDGTGFVVAVSGVLADVDKVTALRRRAETLSQLPNVKLVFAARAEGTAAGRASIEAVIRKELEDFNRDGGVVEPLAVSVLGDPTSDSSFVANLSGDLTPNPAEADKEKAAEAQAAAKKRVAEVVARVKKLNLPGVRIASSIKPAPDAVAERAAPSQTRTVYWPLSYYHMDAGGKGVPAPDAKEGAESGDSIGKLVDALNTLYGTEKEKPVTRAGPRRLFIQGSDRTVFAVMKALALIDAPWPQVQLDVWAIQVAGTQHRVGTQALRVREEIARTRAAMAQTQEWLAGLVRTSEGSIDAGFAGKLTDLGLGSSVNRPLSLNETLICLVGSAQRKAGGSDWLGKQWQMDWQQFNDGKRPHANAPFVPSQMCPPEYPVRLDNSWAPAPMPGRILERLSVAYLPSRQKADLAGVDRFVKAWKALEGCNGSEWQDDLKVLGEFQAALGMADAMLQEGIEAYRADMASMYLNPLLEHLQREPGVSLAGRAHLVVTSSMPMSMEPSMAFQVNSTRPKVWGQDLIDAASKLPPAPATDGAAAATKAPGSNWFAQVFALLPPDQALALAALLNNDVQPVHTTVAPGISIHACPVVLPDNNSARITMDCRFSVATTASPDLKDRKDLLPMPAADAISTHSVTTDANVGVFDLLDISSFTLTASHPQGPLVVPILGRLPLVGGVFQIDRGEKRTRFESILLVNTVIVPRAASMMGPIDLTMAAK